MNKQTDQADESLTQRRSQSRQRMQRWAWLLDDVVRIPIINMRVGLDAFVGLVPVVGDFAGVAMSSVLFAEAVRLRAPRNLLISMGRNIAADFALGLVPLVGDFFDVAWRANRRNLRLLETWLDDEQKRTATKRWPAILAAVLFLAVVGGLCWGLWRLLFG